MTYLAWRYPVSASPGQGQKPGAITTTPPKTPSPLIKPAIPAPQPNLPDVGASAPSPKTLPAPTEPPSVGRQASIAKSSGVPVTVRRRDPPEATDQDDDMAEASDSDQSSGTEVTRVESHSFSATVNFDSSFDIDNGQVSEGRSAVSDFDLVLNQAGGGVLVARNGAQLVPAGRQKPSFEQCKAIGSTVTQVSLDQADGSHYFCLTTRAGKLYSMRIFRAGTSSFGVAAESLYPAMTVSGRSGATAG